MNEHTHKNKKQKSFYNNIWSAYEVFTKTWTFFGYSMSKEEICLATDKIQIIFRQLLIAMVNTSL